MIQSNREQREYLENKSSKRHQMYVTEDPERSWEDGKRYTGFPNLKTIRHTIQKFQQGWAQEAKRNGESYVIIKCLRSTTKGNIEGTKGIKDITSEEQH